MQQYQITMEAIVLEEVEIDAMKNPVLRDRARIGGKAMLTKFFVAKLNQSEVAFLSVDFFPPPQYFSIYEIFVLMNYRGLGLGTTLLRKAEDMALHAGNTKVRLKPKPLDTETNSGKLLSWYRRHGYHPMSGSEYLEKIIQ